MSELYDIVIAGGGLIGTSLAIALQKTNKKFVVIEAKSSTFPNDMRSLALNYASIEFLKELTIWDEIKSYATPIEKIHISEEKSFGKVILDSKALDLDIFGYVIPIVYLYKALMNKAPYVLIDKITEIKKSDNHWELKLNNKHILTKLLIAADGDNSFIRESLNIPTEKIDYHQKAIVTTAKISKPHHNTAYERFTKHGVLAIMPRENNRVGIIWTTDQENVLENTQKTMGYRLGKFSEFGEIQTYPLKFLHAQKQAFDNLILLGNAAHVLHPVAAQGLNLGLRDVKLLSHLIINNNPHLIENYLAAREKDQLTTEKFTANLLKLFAPQNIPARAIRSIAFGVFGNLPMLKRIFCLRRMGALEETMFINKT